MAKQKTNTQMGEVRFERVPFERLVFLEDNPRTRTDEGWRKMAARIEADPTFYDNRPTLVNLVDGVFKVYAGDLRAHVAHEEHGWAEVPCNIQENVPERLMRDRALADNAQMETWDREVLSAWDYEPEELDALGVEWKMEDGETEIEDLVDYSAKNKEVEVDALESSMVISLKYTPDEYWKVKEQLSQIAAGPEQAVWKLLGNE